MNEKLLRRLAELESRFEELSAELADPAVIADQDRFRRYSREYAQLDPVMASYRDYREGLAERDSLEAMGADPDPEMREMAAAELDGVKAQLQDAEQALKIHLLPRDPLDDSNIFLEVRAGTGGDEAALFAGDLFAMYERFAAARGWQIEVLSASDGEHGGYKEIISRVVGTGAYSQFKFEAGTHRVQRVPETESQGRIHTSACTVAILPETDELDEVSIEAKDLKVDTYRASGAGGQHVNKTDSAVRLTHLPSGIVVECQDERSQHKNRARAMALLKARLMDIERERQSSEQAATRKAMVGSGDRSGRIRTYNFPQGRVTDHRINLTVYKLDTVLAGELDLLVTPLTQEAQAEALAAIGA